ncbi:nicotinamide riboside kinase 1 [Xylaria sp. CBS 124048]|nr:nicotinamide riboside kinase 1 [Xylaria sp. CBS 124048]
MTGPKAIIIGVSGASSSGKTTLARLLRDVFPQTFILHEDDFYRPENQLTTKHGLLDWDCPEAIDFEAMAQALEYIREHGTFPSSVDSKEDKNSIGSCPVPDSAINAAKAYIETWMEPGQAGHKIFFSPSSPPSSSSSSTSSSSSFSPKLRICIVDGFLLFGRDAPLRRITDELLDIKLFMTVSREKAVSRRQARDGYVTLEGFWTDPPGYVEKIVWPNYAALHAWLFENGDVEGLLDGDVLRAKNILALPSVVGGGNRGGGGEKDSQRLNVDMQLAFRWAVETIKEKLEEIAS